jgi:hypothetical protein
MATTYNWMIHSMAVVPDVSGLKNAVRQIAWECQARNGSIMKRDQGRLTLGNPSPDNFLEYDDLTESSALNWVWSQVGKDAVEAKLNEKINSALQSDLIVLPNPWDSLGENNG